MKRQKMKLIDSDALRRELVQRNLKASHVSLEMGMAHGYISNILHEGKISGMAATALQYHYNINPEDYVIPETPEQMKLPLVEPDQTPKYTELDYERLYEVVLQAIKDARNE